MNILTAPSAVHIPDPDPACDSHAQILCPEALLFLAELHREYTD